MRDRKPVAAVLIVVSLLAVGSLGLWGGASTDGGAKRISFPDGASLRGSVSMVLNPDKFVVATIGEPDYLDPAVDYESSGWQIIQNVYETLVWYNGSSASELVPLLAEEVPTVANGLISPDGLEYNFNIKGKVKFHDGTSLTADDVVHSIQRVLRIHDPDSMTWALEQVLTDYMSFFTGLTVSDYLDSSYNASWIRAVLEPLGYDHVITEDDVQAVAEVVVEKTSQMGVRIRLTHPYPGFLQILASPVGSVVSEDYVEAHGGIVNAEHNSWMDRNTCGSGPYQLVDWSIGYGINLTRFDDYHGSLPAVTDVQILQVQDINERMRMLQAGEADFAYIPIANESDFTGANYTIFKGSPTFDMIFAGFNMNINTIAAATFGSDVPTDFFQDKHVRMAFASLINYTQFITNVLKGNAFHPNGPIPKGMFGYNASIPEYKQDLAKAEAEFKLAINAGTGNSWWDDGFTVAFMYNAGNVYRETACQYMKTALEGLNSKFHATINALDWPTYLAYLRMSPSPFPLFWFGWAPDYADPDDYVTPMLDSWYGAFPYRTGYSNDTIDALVRMAASEVDEGTRYDLYSQIQMLCYEDVPYVWLYQANNFHIERSWVRGYYFNPMYGGLYYAALWKEEANTPPTASFTISPPTGDTITVFTFDASGCTDLEDPVGVLEVRWDWDNDSVWDTGWSTVKTLDHQYATPGTYTVKIEVRDTGGLSDTTTAEVEVSEWISEFTSIVLPVLVVAASVLLLRRRK